MVSHIDKQAVKSFLLDLQDRICAECEALDTAAQFVEDSWQRTEGGGATRFAVHDRTEVELE